MKWFKKFFGRVDYSSDQQLFANLHPLLKGPAGMIMLAGSNKPFDDTVGKAASRLFCLFEGSRKCKIAIEYTKADEKRARNFALKLKEIFESAGYDVWGYVPAFVQSSGEPITGIQIAIKKGTPSEVVGGYIQRAFQKIDIAAAGVVSTNNNYEDDTVIFVGIKP
jgi:hypothetical protein